jgi:hypothetical protein
MQSNASGSEIGINMYFNILLADVADVGDSRIHRRWPKLLMTTANARQAVSPERRIIAMVGNANDGTPVP